MAKKTNCTEVARRLQSYLDGELDDDWRERVQDHLEACVDCGLEHEAFAAIKMDLKSLSAPPEHDALARLRDFSARLSQEANL